MSYLDAHTHPQFPSYDADRTEVIARAKAADVKMILVGTQVSTSEAAIRLADEHPGDMWATVGFHPNHLVSEAAWHHDKSEQDEAEREKFDPKRLKELASAANVVAIGECGLDYFRLAGSPEGIEAAKRKQEDAFIAQVEIAHDLGKPLMIHCRSAFPELIALLRANRAKLEKDAGVIHFMTGTPEDAKALLELGFAFTFGGVVTFSRDYDATLAAIPSEKILSETDAPYVSPMPYRGKRNEPSYVLENVKKLAELKELSVEAMRDAIWANAERVFGI
jgi:TatD DNase family protein